VVVLQNLLESEKEGNQRLLKEFEEAKQALSVITKKQQEILEPTAVSAIKTMSKTFENVGSSAAAPSLKDAGLGGLIKWIARSSESFLIEYKLMLRAKHTTSV
jgi:hypothetical protein